MSLGALQLNSLFRKYTGQLADIALEENNQKRNFNSANRDLDLSQIKNRKSLSNKKASQGMAHSGAALEERTNLEKGYQNSRNDMFGNHSSNLQQLAKQKLDARAAYDEGTALVNLTELLKKQQGVLDA